MLCYAYDHYNEYDRFLFIVAVVSMSNADSGDMEGARSLGRASMGVSIAGIVITIILAIVCIILWFTWWNHVTTTLLNSDQCDKKSIFYDQNCYYIGTYCKCI